ncbi:hypothetical protein Tco_1270084, partial [Tanacetum coccineum]
RELTNDEVEYLKLFEEEIEVSQPDEKMGYAYYIAYQKADIVGIAKKKLMFFDDGVDVFEEDECCGLKQFEKLVNVSRAKKLENIHDPLAPDEAKVILTDEQNDFLFADASRMEEIEELSANICLMAKIQPTDNTFDVGPSYDSAFIMLFGDDQIDSDIIFDSPNGNVNSGSIEKDTHVPDLWAM